VLSRGLFTVYCLLLHGSGFALEVGDDRSVVVAICVFEGSVAILVGLVDACFPVLNEILAHLKTTIVRSSVQSGVCVDVETGVSAGERWRGL